MEPRAAAEGFVAIAVANMANAIKKISVARGHNVTRYTLACFGGAGGQHACLVADALAMDRVMIHPLAGVLSAYGMGLADRRVVREATLALPLGVPEIAEAVERLSGEARASLVAQDVGDAVLRTEVHLFLRYASTESAIEVGWGDEARMRAAFAAAYRARFGYEGEGALVADMVRVEAIAESRAGEGQVMALPTGNALPLGTVAVFMAGEERQAPVLDRLGLASEAEVDGPALIVDPSSTTVVEPGWRATVDPIGNLMLARVAPRAAASNGGAEADPVRLEIFNGLFMAIAEEMGAALQHSASSVNIRERLDFSCALFDAVSLTTFNI